MRYLLAHAQHIGDRSYQQDSWGFADADDAGFLAHGGLLAVLCDGMGGMDHGDVASRTAVWAMLEAYHRKSPSASIPAALERSVREANQSVIQAALGLGKTEGVGTTLVAVVLRESSLYFISVGDSAVFHLSQGELRMLNRAHVFGNVLDRAADSGAIPRREAERHPEREALTSFIGIHQLEEIDQNTQPVQLCAGETILLASDGMFKTLNAEQMLACLRGDPQSWPQLLVDHTLAQRSPGQDNVTVCTLTVEGVTPADPAEARGVSAMLQPVRGAEGSGRVVRIVAALLAVALAALWYFSR